MEILSTSNNDLEFLWTVYIYIYIAGIQFNALETLLVAQFVLFCLELGLRRRYVHEDYSFKSSDCFFFVGP